jgi:hypothetical protein
VLHRGEALARASRRGARRGDAGLRRWVAGLERAGRHRATEKLAWSPAAKTLRVQGGRPVVTDGPYAETKEQFGGFHIVEAERPRRSALDRSRDPDAARRRHRRGAPRGAPGLIDFDALYRDESRRVLATLIRLLGDFDLAEEALSEAFAAAIEQWPRDGVPDNPRAWLFSRALQGDRRDPPARALRHRARGIVEEARSRGGRSGRRRGRGAADDRLRLVFTCCHPALGPTRRLR